MLQPFLKMLVGLLVIALARVSSPAEKKPKLELTWYEVTARDVSGKGFDDTKAPFDRLPARAEKMVRQPVWDLSHHSAGLYVDFRTNATTISARWTLTSDRLAMPHMPATAVSGLDLYIRRGVAWHYLGTGRPKIFPTNEMSLATGLAGQESEYRLYFPLYNGVTAVEIGVPTGASLAMKPGLARQAKPIVVYGTSITQGGCASRPGMSFAAILGRRLDVPVINLGFSGNGKAELELAQLMAEIDASVFLLDPLPNLYPRQVEERLPGFITELRRKHKTTPILLNENPRYPPVEFLPDQMQRVTESNQYLQQIGGKLAHAGDANVIVIPACDLTTSSGDATVDGVHPTDVGFVKMADTLEPYLRKVLTRN